MNLTVLVDAVKFLIAHGPEEQAAAVAVVGLYRDLRGVIPAEADALTDAQLAALLQTEGAAIRVTTDHWLAEYGFGPESA